MNEQRLALFMQWIIDHPSGPYDLGKMQRELVETFPDLVKGVVESAEQTLRPDETQTK